MTAHRHRHKQWRTLSRYRSNVRCLCAGCESLESSSDMLHWRVVLRVGRIGQVGQQFRPQCVVMWVLVSLVVACGRTLILVVAPLDGDALGPERCNSADDDGDRRVDETFRDERGRYVADE